MKKHIEVATMSDSDLMALILNPAMTPAAKKAADKIMSTYRAYSRLTASGLGVREPAVKVSNRVKAIVELGRRMEGKAGIFLKPRDVWEELGDIRKAKKEHFIAFFLDTRNKEIHREIVSIGTLNYNLVHPREVFNPAVKALAAAIIVAHNHPSGCLEPSDEDISLTKRLTQAGRLLGIEVLDHVIVSGGGWMSFKEKGLLQ